MCRLTKLLLFTTLLINTLSASAEELQVAT
ncbi:hypothetical protein MNBD_GAMMA21-3036, partial [hydrothermal vent metagenome]